LVQATIADSLRRARGKAFGDQGVTHGGGKFPRYILSVVKIGPEMLAGAAISGLASAEKIGFAG